MSMKKSSYGVMGLVFLVLAFIASFITGCNGGSNNPGPAPVTLQSISIAVADSTIAPIGINRQFTATGHYSNGTTANLTTNSSLTWVSSNTAAGTISAGGLFVPAAIGSSTVTAKVGGVVSNPITMTTTTAVLQSITVSATDGNPATALGVAQGFIATGTFSDNSNINITSNVTWTSESVAVATISNAAGTNGIATPIQVGTSNITASLQGITSAPMTLTVTNATVVSIQISAPNYAIPESLNTQFTATALLTDGTYVDVTSSASWSSSSSIVSVSNTSGTQGLVTAGTTRGTANISATYSGKTSAAVPVTVTPASLQSIAVTLEYSTTGESVVQNATAIGTFSDNSTLNITSQVNWTESGTPNVAVVAGGGYVQSVTPGNATIVATLNGVSGSAPLTVTNNVLTGLVLVATAESTSLGIQQSVKAIGTYDNESTFDMTNSVTFTSSNTATATITSGQVANAGVINPVAVGTTNIVASLGSESSQALVFKVNNLQVISLDITPSSESLPAGTTAQLTVTATYSNGTKSNLTNSNVISWSSSNPAIATVTSAGEVTAVATSGTTMINASINTPSGIVTSANPTVITTRQAVLQEITINQGSVSIAQGQTQQYTATGTFSDGTTADITNNVTWASSNSSVASISNSLPNIGLATATGNSGNASITASLGTITSTSKTFTATSPVQTGLTLTAPANALSVSSTGFSNTMTLTLTQQMSNGASNNVTGSATSYTSSNTTYATVSGSGVVTAQSSTTPAPTITVSGVYNSTTSNSVSIIIYN